MIELMSSPARIVFWGTYDGNQPRIRLLEDGLRLRGCQVFVCHHNVWAGFGDKVAGLSFFVALRVLWRLLLAYPRLLWAYCRLPTHDVALVSHPGLLDVLLLRPLVSLRSARLAWDVYVSWYDTLVLDRGVLEPSGIPARLLWHFERWVWSLVDHPFADTAAHAARLEHIFAQPSGRCGRVWVGAESLFLEASESREKLALQPLNILFYGTFLPLHGMPSILAAARKLAHLPLSWTVIGEGPVAGAIRADLEQSPLPQWRWRKSVTYEELVTHLGDADLVLGIFGANAKADSVVPNKVFQALFAGKSIITRDSAGIRELFAPLPAGLTVVPPDDPAALAEAVEQFFFDFSPSISPHQYFGVLPEFQPARLAEQFLGVVGAVVDEPQSSI